MKTALRLISLVALACMLPAARAADVNGTWKGAFDFQGSSMPVTLTLKVADAAVTGSMEGLPTSPAEIHDGKIEGDSITFWLNSDYQGQTYKLVYKGKITGDTIDFDFGTDDGSWGTSLTVKREGGSDATPAAANVSGAWSGSFDFNGSSVPVTFKLASSGATVTGTVEGMGPAPAEIHDGKIDGDMVSFWLNTDYQGQTYKLVYKGKIAGDTISFDFGTEDGGWGASVAAKKS